MVSKNGTTYADSTDVKVIAIIENYMHSGKRLRVFYGDTVTGEDWGEENDVIGRIGRSMGTSKIPLLVYNRHSFGGGGIPCNSIVKIVDVASKRVLYRHSNYHQPVYTIKTSLAENLPYMVYANDKNVANFKSATSASNWVLFMTGKRMCK